MSSSRRDKDGRAIARIFADGIDAISANEDDRLQVARAIWDDYQATLPSHKKIRKPKTHAAGVHYAMSKLLGLGVTQKTISRHYHVSSGKVSKMYRIIWAKLSLEVDDPRYASAALEASEISEMSEAPPGSSTSPAGTPTSHTDASTALPTAGLLAQVEVRALMARAISADSLDQIRTLWQEHARDCVTRGSHPSLMKMARACATHGDHELAIEILEELAAHHIDQKTRKQYELAATTLVALRDLYKQAELELGWGDFFAILKETTSSLKSLHEEFDRQGLSA